MSQFSFKKTSIMMAVVAGFGLGMIQSASAGDEFVTNTSKEVVKNSAGECWQIMGGDKVPECMGAQPAPAAAPAQPAQQPAASCKLQVSIENFDFDKAKLKPAMIAELDKLVDKTKSCGPKDVLVVIGHTCNIGSDAYNQRLSERRAQSVADYLKSKGIKGDQLQVKGMGEKQPAYDNKTKEGRSKNRRVEVMSK
jgi:OmpA-OmpF porin, OOP family